MAKLCSSSSNCLLLLLFSSLLAVSSSGTLVGFSYDARQGPPAAPLLNSSTVSFSELNKVSSSHARLLIVADHRVLNKVHCSGLSIDLHLHENLIPNLVNSKSSAISWLKTHVVTFPSRENIKSITVSGSHNLLQVLSTLKLVHSAIATFHLDSKLKISVAFSLPSLEKLNTTQQKNMHRIVQFIKNTGSFITVEASAGLGKGDLFLQTTIQKAALAASLLPWNDVPIVLIVRSLVVTSANEADEFVGKISKALEKSGAARQVAEIYAEVAPLKSYAKKGLEMDEEQHSSSSRRELQNKFKTIMHDVINPPTTVLPSTSPVTLPPNIPTPTIVTVPATNPVTVTPVSNPPATPLTVPSTNPSVNPPAPITNPVTTPTPVTIPGAQPVTNPVTTYPAPAGNVPVTTPVTNPVAAPATTNPSVNPGQSWCVAKSGALQTALQAALDYACGMGGADCSQIQQGGSCYNPDNLQNHASYAFNSYYQKNPVQSSCDFGGTATVVNVNPSMGSCIYPSSSSSASTSSLPTPSTSATNPVTTSPIPSSSGTPPSVLNSGTHGSGTATVFGSEAPPGVTSSTSGSVTWKPFASCFVMLTSLVVGVIALNM